MPEKEEIIYKICRMIGHLSAMQEHFGKTVLNTMIDEDVSTCTRTMELLKELPGSKKRVLTFDGVLCGNCGRRIRYDSKFCDMCGWKVEKQ